MECNAFLFMCTYDGGSVIDDKLSLALRNAAMAAQPLPRKAVAYDVIRTIISNVASIVNS
jgi:hypothetical protein